MDVAAFEDALHGWCLQHPGQSPRGLILGVTPELHRLPWPDESLLRAVDRTPAMIAHVWPGDPAAVLLSDWLEIDLPAAKVDIALCDGGLHLLDYPQGQSRLCELLGRAVLSGGIVAFRLFVPPLDRETPEQVVQALLDGRIRDLNCLKLRLGMALQDTPETGVALIDIWRRLKSLAADWSELAGNLGWRTEHLEVIDAYRDSGASYHFVTVKQAIDLFGAHGFMRIATHVPKYEMGMQCPTVVFRRH